MDTTWEAHGEAAPIIYIDVEVKRFGLMMAKFEFEFDINRHDYTAAQLKKDILGNKTRSITTDLRDHPLDCILLVCLANGTKTVVENDEEMQKYVSDLAGGLGRFQILEPGADIPKNEVDFSPFNVNLIHR